MELCWVCGVAICMLSQPSCMCTITLAWLAWQPVEDDELLVLVCGGSQHGVWTPRSLNYKRL